MEKAKESRDKISLWGWFFIVTGLIIIALSLDLLPVDDSMFGAPRWVVGIAGSIFTITGSIIFLGDKSKINNLLAGCLLTGMGLVGGWVGLFGADEGFSGGMPFLPETVNISLARSLFGMGALICFLMSAYAFKLQFESINTGNRESND